MVSWQFTDEDKAFLSREVEPHLPDRIFDAHAHLFRHDHFSPGVIGGFGDTPNPQGLAEFYEYSEWIHPGGRTQGGLFFGLAFMGDREANNDYIAAEVNGPLGKNAFGQMIIAPDMEPDYIAGEVQRHGFVGLKCYHTMAQVDGPTWAAPIEAYLPEAHMEVANQFGLSITLHMVRDRALADPLNQATIRRYCETYPKMNLILAHAARGFNPWHTIEGIHSLKGLNNVWFDTSAVTEAGAFEAIIETMGHERLFYGTDFHVSHIHGRCVAIGDSFHWFYANDMDKEEKHIKLAPVLVGLESLRSLILAFQRLKLTDNQIEDIFYNNARQLYPLPA
ncbi:MAG: amidohydrolase family protein [Anaerolineales bacterium]|nr:amidohydrolase family protein [Anaerolineales bacterium]